jgi:hypothetical protein
MSRPIGPLVRCVGGDPGARTGLVCIDVPRDTFGRGGATRGWQYVASTELAPSTSAKLTDAEQDASLYLRVLDQLAAWRPELIVLEEPFDALGGVWANATRNVKGHARGTSFGVGRAYGLLLAACAAYHGLHYAEVGRDLRIVSYPVTTTKEGRASGRLGWMQDTARTPTARDATLLTCRMALRAMGAPPAALATPKGNDREDVLLAFGVLAYHIGTARAAQLLPGAASAA